jgi:hypothetical protein
MGTRLALILILILARARGQDFRATIAGQVTDASHAAVPEAVVKAIHKATNTVTEARTNKEGYYTLPYLQPSTYDIEVIAEGFSRYRKEGIVLMVADKMDLAVILELGKVTEAITVHAEQELIQTGNASGGLNFDELMTSEYSLNGRQAYMLMDLTPGVIFTQEEFGVSGYSGTRGWDVSGAYVMNGGMSGTNQFLLNGAPISLTGAWQVAPNMEAIQEFKVMTNTYDSQYGRTGGGTVNTTIKSGSNRVHGSAFEYLRNSILDANWTQNNRVGAPRGKHITNQFGGTLGGAIRRDRDFFFVSFEGFRERVPFPVVSDVAPLDFRDGQHFSQYGYTVFDPLTVHTCVKGVDTSGNANCSTTYIRNPFPGDVLPASRISPVAKGLLNLMPAPNGPGLTQNYFATGNTGRYGYDQPMGRWDHMVGSADRIYAMFTFQHGHEYRNQNGFPGVAAYGNLNTQRTDQNYIADWTHILSPTMMLDVRASFGRFTSYFPNSLLDSNVTAASLGMTDMPVAPTFGKSLPPRIDFGSSMFSSLVGNGANQYSWSTNNQWDFAINVTQSQGKHTRKYGFEYVYASIGANNIGRANGEFSFNPTWTTQYATRQNNKSDGSEMADLLLGMPTSGYLDYNDTSYRTWPYYAWYVQDDWKILSKLTLNFGLRYDIQVPWVERFNGVSSGFNYNAVNPLSNAVLANWAAQAVTYNATKPQFPFPSAPAALLGGETFIQPGQSRHIYLTDFQNIQPRFGLAWNFAPKTVLRTGFGIYHQTVTQAGNSDGFSQKTNYIDSLDGGVTPSAGLTGPYSLQNPFPNGIVAPSGGALGLLTNIGNSISMDGAQRVVPRTFQYSFGLQQRLPWNSMIEATYAGSITEHAPMTYQADYYPYADVVTGEKTNSFLNRKVNNPFYGILPITSTQGASPQIAAQELFRPFPENNGLTINTNPWARYRYDALQLRAEKRFFGDRKTGALTLIFSYTFSKNWQDANLLNNWNLSEKPVHELTSYDKPQTVAFSGVWDVPFGAHRLVNPSNRIVSAVVSGWGMNWVYKYNSGYPLGMGNWVFSCNTYFALHQDHDHWFNNNLSCYHALPGYVLRTNPDRFENLRQMDNSSLNLTLTRTFRMTERYSLQLRGEAFNAMNHPLYGAPITDYTKNRFGLLPIGQQNFPRLIQLAMKFMF